MRHRSVGVARSSTHGGDELQVQERHVGRRREGQLLVDGLQAREQALKRTLPLARVLDYFHAVGQLRQPLTGGPDDDDWAADPARDDATRAP